MKRCKLLKLAYKAHQPKEQGCYKVTLFHGKWEPNKQEAVAGTHLNPIKNFHRRIRRNWNATTFPQCRAIAKQLKAAQTSQRNVVKIPTVSP